MAEIYLEELKKWIETNNLSNLYILDNLDDTDPDDYLIDTCTSNVNYFSNFLYYIKSQSKNKDKELIKFIRESIREYNTYFISTAIEGTHLKDFIDTLIFFGLKIDDRNFEYLDNLKRNINSIEEKMKKAVAGRKIVKAVKKALDDEHHLTELRMRIDLRKYTDLVKEREVLFEDIAKIVKGK